jgi:hypothetical protein
MAFTSRRSVEVADSRVCESEGHVGNSRVRCFPEEQKK